MNVFKKLSQLVRFSYLPILFIATLSCNPSETRAQEPDPTITDQNPTEQSIMLALLLDTSNSMDGLIDQAKSQLWTIVNELAEAKCENGTPPKIKIALYEYGNNNLPMTEGYIRMVCPLTSDLDLISGKLFGLTTDGGEEYCGQVIHTSLNQLNWSTSDADLKMIFIAGNEGFNQGSFSYGTACRLANEKEVTVNTIFCGGYDEGIRAYWKKGADLTKGTYMSIQQDHKTVYVATPYDNQIDALNTKLNSTYITFNASGVTKLSDQVKQDENANSYSRSNKVKRAISKSSHAYKNHSWDLVDAAEKDSTIIGTVGDSYLPEEMKAMNKDERKKYVNKKAKERSDTQKEIQDLNTKRKQYIAEHTPEENEEMLDKALIKSIKEKAKTKKILFDTH